jgi:acetyltransferase-like isoleucine patch superfamily enzyme
MSQTHHLEHDWYPRPLPSNVTIGPRSWCYSAFAFLHYQSRRPCGLHVGHDTGIYNGTFFDLGPEGEVTIGDYCTLVGAIIATNGPVVIGDYAFLAHEVTLGDHMAATPEPPHRPSEAGDAGEAGVANPSKPIILGPNCWIGARAILLGGANIGEGAIIGAAAVVENVIPPYTIAAGNPARVIKRIR